VELRNPIRWTIPDWGMPRFDLDNIKSGPFFAALSREIRTRAIQLHISVFESEQEKLRSTAYDQFNNPWWRGQAFKRLHFGKFKCPQDLTNWMCDLRERTYNAWSVDRIRYEWEIRLNHIRHWMETK
jgi:hypothetical protein